MMSSALPVATPPEQHYHDTRSKNPYVDNPDFRAKIEENSSCDTELKSKSKVAGKKTAASSLPLSGPTHRLELLAIACLFSCNEYLKSCFHE